MKKILFGGLVAVLFFIVPFLSMAGDSLTEADALFKKGGLEDYKRSIALYLKALKANPESYAVNWKTARAYRWYGEESKRQGVQGWKDICEEYGEMGMKYGEKAIALNPGGVEGHYYYGLNVGIYSDGVSIITALRKGLKGKTQSSFEKAYEIDKTYDKSGPTIAIGRFWFVLPWPMHDKKKSLTFLRESQKTAPSNISGQLYLAEALLDRDKEGDEAEAKALLQKVAVCPIKYFRDWAKRLLADLK
jgi:tetratricopeptide (TPR) repeat protein